VDHEKDAQLGEQILRLASRLEGLLNWSWDGRFGTALAEFPIEQKERVLGVLEELLVSRWDSAGIADAPSVVRSLVSRLGGLMSGQLLLLSDPGSDSFLYCAWWPWGNGQTISVRLAPFGPDLPADRLEALTTLLRNQLGI